MKNENKEQNKMKVKLGRISFYENSSRLPDRQKKCNSLRGKLWADR